MPASPRVKSPPVTSTSAAKPRTKPAEVRREELLDAAERLFMQSGIAATSVDEIVSAADVSKGTFYLYFTSKEALLLGLQQRYLLHFCSRIEEATARKKPDDHRGRLRAWVQAAFDAFMEQQKLHDMLFHEYRPQENKPSRENDVFQSMSELIRKGSDAGAWEVSDPELTGLMLLYAMHGATDAATAAKSAAERKAVWRTLDTFALRVVGAR